METAQAKLDFIRAHALAGRTVYLSTALRHIAIKAKHLAMIRVNGDNLEVMQGKQGWVNANYCKLSAR
jgi:hypothetical protein